MKWFRAHARKPSTGRRSLNAPKTHTHIMFSPSIQQWEGILDDEAQILPWVFDVCILYVWGNRPMAHGLKILLAKDRQSTNNKGHACKENMKLSRCKLPHFVLPRTWAIKRQTRARLARSSDSRSRSHFVRGESRSSVQRLDACVCSWVVVFDGTNPPRGNPRTG